MKETGAGDWASLEVPGDGPQAMIRLRLDARVAGVPYQPANLYVGEGARLELPCPVAATAAVGTPAYVIIAPRGVHHGGTEDTEGSGEVGSQDAADDAVLEEGDVEVDEEADSLAA